MNGDCGCENSLEVCKAKVVLTTVDHDPQHFRIITRLPPYKEVAVASSLYDIEIAFQILKIHVLPELKGGFLQYIQALDSLSEKTKDIQSRLEGYLYVSLLEVINQPDKNLSATFSTLLLSNINM